MQVNQDSGSQGLSGPDALDSGRWTHVSGIQESGGAARSVAEALAGGTTDDGPSSGGSGQHVAIQSFAAKPWVPEEYQNKGVIWLASRTAGALFLPPGMGKTSMSLAAKLKLTEMGFPSRTLVLAPLTVCLTTWLAEPQKWFQFQGLKVGLAHGPDKELVLNDDYYDIVVLNYDGISWAAPLLAKGHNFQVLLCDEIRRLKNTSSKRYKTLKPLLPSFAFRWGLTGTPAANGLMDLFGQCYVLDLGQRLGRFITHFRLKYFHQKPWDQYRYHITQEKAEELVDKIGDMAMYMDPKDWLKLPPLLNIEILVEFDKETMARYKELENDFILKLDSGVVTAANAGVLTSKLRQFTGGAVYSSPGIWDAIHTAKLERLEELIDELQGEPLMVAYNFEHEFERLIARYPNALYIKGGMNKTRMQNTVEVWNTGESPLLFIQPQAGSLGLNLQFGGHAIVWFTQTYNLEDYIQQIARLLRREQKIAVKNYLLNVKGTIDQLLTGIMTEKGMTQDMVFERLKSVTKCNNSVQLNSVVL